MGRVSIQLSIVISAFFLMSAPSARAGDFIRVCTYYSNSSFADRHLGRTEALSVRLAQGCHDALRTFQRARAGTEAHDQAEDYLVRLTSYRRLLLDMAGDRFRQGGGADRPGLPRNRSVVRPVSTSGAYLIAKVTGLLDSHSAWTAWHEAEVR